MIIKATFGGEQNIDRRYNKRVLRGLGALGTLWELQMNSNEWSLMVLRGGWVSCIRQGSSGGGGGKYFEVTLFYSPNDKKRYDWPAKKLNMW